MNNDNVESIYPLSPMQEGMLFHSIDGKESKVYVVVLHFSLHGALNVSAFKLAWQQVLDRHPVLRTFFIWKNRETPLQIVRRRVDLPWQDHDWRHMAASEQTKLLKSFLQADREKGFNLSKAPLMRFTLVQMSENDYHFFFSHQHMLLDGWSMGLLLREVFAVYQAICSGENISLEKLQPYKTYITWLKQQDFSEAELYWRKTLQGFTQPTPIHLDETLGGSNSSMETYDEQQFRLPKAITAKFQSLAQQQKITLGTLIHGVWAVLLNRYSGETDIVFGTVVSGRSIALTGIESMIGLFINTLPVRVQISPQTSLVPWLKELQGQQIQARRFEYSSLRNIQAWSELVRSQGQSLFDSILVFGNYPLNDILKDAVGDLEIGDVSFLEGSNYPLTVLIDPNEELTIRISYETRRYSDATIVQIFNHFQTLLEAFVANPYQPLSALSILTEGELQKLLVDFNQTTVSYPTNTTLTQLFEAQVAKTPEAVAVQYGQEYLTYAQLNRRANQLAHFLQKMGIEPETLVGVFMERSLEMVICLYGILKAGGAYVPLDPEYPAERVAFMLEDTQVPVLLTQNRLLEQLSSIQNLAATRMETTAQISELICLDSEWSTIAQESPDNPVSGAKAENLAYVIYTSGSTGRPKGVMNEHRGICNRLLWMQNEYQLTETDRVLQKTPFSFDVSVWEFFWPLLFGARLVVAKLGGHKDSDYLVNLIVEQEITTIHFVPSMLQAFLLNENVENCQSLKRVICSGEALPYTLQERFFARLKAELHNLYGPTEAAVDVTYWACQRESELATVPIGRPVANTQIYLLDPELQPVPIGVPGELHIGGVQVARGYLNREELTAEKFIGDPFSSDDGARLYKTGDLARYLPDGNILYLGRKDHQVKIRGNRIELGEIEATLSQHPSVREVVVVAHEFGPGDNRLAAYVVPKQEQSISISQLRDFLSKKLPEYMIPASYTMLDTMPLTPNGKVNRKALPIPEFDRSILTSDFMAPRNATEETLAEIWAQVIGLERVGINDNFFDLGGDSIISLQIVAKARQAGLRLIPQQLFEYQTISELSSAIGIAESVIAEQGLISGSVPLIPIQHWFFELSMSNRNYWNQSVMIDVLDELDLKLLEQTLQQLLTQHDALRLQFLPETSAASQEWKQSINQTLPTIDFEVIDISDLPQIEQQEIVEITKSRLEAGHNLEQGKLINAAYFEPDRLFISIHHLVIDGISWSILLQDIEAIYTKLVRDESIILPAKTTSFKAWAEKLNEFAQTKVVKQEMDYWIAVSEGVTGEIPVDASAKATNTESSKRTISVSLSLEETRSLLKEVPPVYNTQINDALLTALAQTITSWADQTALFISLEGHGREEIIKNVDLSRTSGWFTTIFPIKLTLPDSPSPSAALKSVKEQLRGIPNRGIGYGLLRYLCQDEGVRNKLATLAKPQILFNYLGQFDRALPDSALFRFTQPLMGAHSPEALRSHLLEVNMIVINGCLRMDWNFSQNIHRRETIQQLADNYAEALRTLIAHVLSPDEAGGFTPSDFPLANLDEEKINQIANKLNEPE
jgi:amino acid adenylation domain-containing protein/non-ribosomal peptide synthase protein (TIGR01720 family)